MDTIAGLIIYLTVCGILGGMAHNHHHEKCGTKGSITHEEILAAAVLPVSLGYAIALDDDLFEKAECKGTPLEKNKPKA